MTTHEPRPRSTATFIVVAVALFTDMLLYTLVIPVLPVHATSLGASATAVSALFVVYSVAMLVCTPIAGQLSDRAGRRGPMVWGLLGMAVSTILFALATEYWQLLAARVLQGIAGAVTWSVGLALLADIVPAADRVRTMGFALTVGSTGTLVGPPLGGLLYDLGGYRLPFLAAAAIVLVDALARLLLIYEPPRSAERTEIKFLTFMRDPVARSVAWSAAIGSAGMTLLEPTLPVFLVERVGVSPSTVGLLFAGATLAWAVSAPLTATVAARIGRRQAMVLGLVLMGGVLPAIGLALNPWMQVGLLALMGLAMSLVLSPALAELGDVTDRLGGGAYGVAYAIFNTAFSLGLVLGPLLAGPLTDAFGFSVAMVLSGLVMLVGAGWLSTSLSR